MNIGNANNNTSQIEKVNSITSTEVADSNPHNFTNFNLVRSNPTDQTPVGNIKEITYNGEVIGEIKQLAGFKQISSNLSPKDTSKIYSELKSEGKADSLTINDSFKAGDSIHNNIVAELGRVKKNSYYRCRNSIIIY